MSTPNNKKPRDGSSPVPGHGLPLPPGSQHVYSQGSGGGIAFGGTNQALTTGAHQTTTTTVDLLCFLPSILPSSYLFSLTPHLIVMLFTTMTRTIARHQRSVGSCIHGRNSSRCG